MKKVMVLASGGLDSSLVMAKLLEEGYDVYPFFCNYCQHSYEGESKSVRKVVEWLKFKTPDGCSNIAEWTLKGSIKDVVEIKVDVGLGTIAACPGRVLAFAGAACIWAFTQGWTDGSIAIGIHRGDKDQDSCRVGYQDELNETTKILTQDCINVITPLMGMSREEMAMEIDRFGIPFEIMYNCYWGVPCGWQSKNMDYLCPGCRRKREAMDIVSASAGEPLWTKTIGPNCYSMSTTFTRRDWKKLV